MHFCKSQSTRLLLASPLIANDLSETTPQPPFQNPHGSDHQKRSHSRGRIDTPDNLQPTDADILAVTSAKICDWQTMEQQGVGKGVDGRRRCVLAEGTASLRFELVSFE